MLTDSLDLQGSGTAGKKRTMWKIQILVWLTDPSVIYGALQNLKLMHPENEPEGVLSEVTPVFIDYLETFRNISGTVLGTMHTLGQ